MTVLSDLPAEVRADARIDQNGEVSWSDSAAAAAINALTATGRVVLGLDVRFYDSTGRFYEIPWSSFEPDVSRTPFANAESSRQAALAALGRIDELERPDDTVERRVLVTWQ
jgi:hypothetical protein